MTQDRRTDRPGPATIELDRPAAATAPRPAWHRRWRVAPALAGCLLLGAATAPTGPVAITGPPLPAHATLLATGGLLLVAEPTTLTGYTTDRPDDLARPAARRRVVRRVRR